MSSTRYVKAAVKGTVDNLHRAVDVYGLDAQSIPWYRKAHVEIAYMANQVRIPFGMAAVTVALLSPSKRWEENVTDAHRFIAAAQSGGNPLDLPWTGVSHTGPRQAYQAWELYLLHPQCFMDASAAHAALCSVCKGPKVQSFAANLIWPTTSAGRVTIDSHAYLTWLGEYDSQGMVGFTRGNYYKAEADYCQAAEEYNLLPHEFQAALWTARRNWLAMKAKAKGTGAAQDWR